MELSDDLLCLYSERVTERNGTYVIEVPKREVEVGDVQSGEVYRVAIVSSESPTQNERDEQDDRPQRPPVKEDDIREVEIEDVGDQGDGIAKVERGYVVIVPDTAVGDRVTVRVTEARENVAFTEVVN
ncbi:TRAM domain-containing protein [Halobiforma nitratireducens]|uniref:Deoxyribonuclease/rho motif-related TRAM n=1 Tax=Halobiforma nitratireducens JCM 10879 TaxID=1227454 RepID=M0MLD5_9EURY|nr:TRAM domain-containing protein [Halobiforma nitratireducens]EMA46492.1 deoxyribonuclease/rho motif-related TRAM [Halobiforma nitratireducens JCM 10879]